MPERLISAQALAVFFFMEGGDRPGSGLINFAAAVHAAAGRGRGEALAAEPFDRARVLGGAFRRRVDGVCAVAVFLFVTLGTVSSSDWACPEALGLRTRASSRLAC